MVNKQTDSLENDERRRNKRHSCDKKLELDFVYDFHSKIEYQHGFKGEEKQSHRADTLNLSLDGICFCSPERLIAGKELDIDVHIPDSKKIVHLKGEVRWCRPTPGGRNQDKKFYTGVHLSTIDNEPVDETVYFDEKYGIYWSQVLESILGEYRVVKQTEMSKS